MRRLVALVAVLALAGGCGGGGDADDARAPSTGPRTLSPELLEDVTLEDVERVLFAVRAQYACEEIAEGVAVLAATSPPAAARAAASLRRTVGSWVRVLRRDGVPRDEGSRAFYASLRAQLTALGDPVDARRVQQAFARVRAAALGLPTESVKCEPGSTPG